MNKMNRRNFTKLLLGTAAFGMAGFPDIGHIYSSQQIGTDYRSQLNDIGIQLIKNRNLTSAITKLNTSLILKSVQEAKQVFADVYGQKGSPEANKSFNQAALKIFRETDTSGVTFAVLQIMPTIGKNFNFSNPAFIQDEIRLTQQVLGVNISGGEITRIAKEIDKQKSMLFARYGGKAANPATQLANFVAGGGMAGAVASGISNIAQLADWDKISGTQKALAILSLILLAVGIILL